MTDALQGQPETEQPVKLSADVEDLAPGGESDDVVGGITAVEKPLGDGCTYATRAAGDESAPPAELIGECVGGNVHVNSFQYWWCSGSKLPGAFRR